MINIYDFLIEKFNNSKCLFCDKNNQFDHLKDKSLYTSGTISIHCSCVSYCIFNYNNTYLAGGISGQINHKSKSLPIYLDCTFDSTSDNSYLKPYMSIMTGHSIRNRGLLFHNHFDNTNSLINLLKNINQIFDKCKKLLVLT